MLDRSRGGRKLVPQWSSQALLRSYSRSPEHMLLENVKKKTTTTTINEIKHICNSQCNVYIRDIQGGVARLRLSFVDEKLGVPPYMPSCYAHVPRQNLAD